MKNWKTKLVLGIFSLLPFLSSAQCAMCRAVLRNEDKGGTAEAINNGITFLVIWPYLLVGLVFFLIWRMRRSIKKESQ